MKVPQRLLAASAVALSHLLAAPALAQPQPQRPEAVASAFYAWVLSHPSISLPSAGERAKLAAFLSPVLLDLLREASVMEKRCIAAAPQGDKPLLLEGDLFAGNYEGATEVAYGEPVSQGEGSVSLDVNLMYVDTRFRKAHRHRAYAWKSELELRLADGRWRIGDVKFRHGGTLARGLEDYLREGREACAGKR